MKITKFSLINPAINFEFDFAQLAFSGQIYIKEFPPATALSKANK